MQIFRPENNERQVLRVQLQSMLRRAVLFGCLWLILVEGVTASWWVGIPVILIVSATSAALLPPMNPVWRELPGFILFFFTRSLLGGVDVAWRAVHPGLPIAPALILYPLRLPSGMPQVFLANTISLLPGTLSAELDSNLLKIHVLNGRKGILPELEMLEQKVAVVFGATLPANGTGNAKAV